MKSELELESAGLKLSQLLAVLTLAIEVLEDGVLQENETPRDGTSAFFCAGRLNMAIDVLQLVYSDAKDIADKLPRL